MNKEMNKKVLYLGLALLIIAGIIVVLLKGFNVDLMLEQHKEITYNLGTNYEMSDIKSICKDVFGNERTIIKEVEFFNEAFAINVSSITDEQKTNLVNKLNEKYGQEKTVDDLTISNIPNVRIRDWVNPYIKPICISVFIIMAYIAIRFRKLNTLKLLGNLILKITLTILAILSVIAICRLPIIPSYIILLTIIAVAECCAYLYKYEEKLVEEKNKNQKKKKSK